MLASWVKFQLTGFQSIFLLLYVGKQQNYGSPPYVLATFHLGELHEVLAFDLA